MSAKHGRVEAMVTVPSGDWTCTIQGGSDGGGLTATLAAGTYYPSSLVTATQTAFNATATLDTWTVSWASGEDGSGKVTISATGGNYTLTWVDSEWRDLLGFEDDGTLSGASTNTSTDQAKSCWFPDGPKVSPYGDSDDGWYETDLRSTESPSGTVHALAGNKKQVLSLMWNGISRAKTRIAGKATGNESFEQFWLDAVYGEGPGGTPGALWNVYWDADVATAVNVAPIGLVNFSDIAEQLVDGMIEQWRIRCPRLVKVPV